MLLEEARAIAREFYAAILTDTESRTPLVLFSTEAGWTSKRSRPRGPARCAATGSISTTASVRRRPALSLDGLDLGPTRSGSKRSFPLYRVGGSVDAELIEINPLALLEDGRVVALDCKLTLDDRRRSGIRTSPPEPRPNR